MDEELEQRGVTPKSFFDQVTETRETAQAAQKVSNSNLSLLNELREKVEIISNDLRILQGETNAAKDKAFEEEDKKQKEEMKAKVKQQNEKTQGAVVGGSEGGSEGGSPKGGGGGVMGFISSLIGGLVGGTVGLAIQGIGGIIGLGAGVINAGKKLGEKLAKGFAGLFGKKKKKKKGEGESKPAVSPDKLLNTNIDDEEKDSKKLTTVREKGKVVGGTASQEQSDLMKRQIDLEEEMSDALEANDMELYEKLEKESEEIDKKLFNLEKSSQPKKKKDKRGILGMIGGSIDALTGNLTDFDKRGGKTFGATRVATGMADFFTADMFDLDKRGKMDLFGMRKKMENKRKKEAFENNPRVKNFRKTVEGEKTKFNEYGFPVETTINQDGSVTSKSGGKVLAGEPIIGDTLSVKQRKAIVFGMQVGNTYDTEMLELFEKSGGANFTKEENKKFFEEHGTKDGEEEDAFGFNQGGLVQGYNQGGEVDSVPAMLTPGEFVVTKDAVEKVGADTLKGLNASVGATNKASNLGSFEIKRLDPNDLSKDALVKKSSFVDGIKDVEISNESGSDYFRSTTDMSTGGLSETTVKRTRFTETSEDGTVTVFSKDTTMTEKTVSIGVPDLIEHQDQLLGEIHKLKGFENVTIDQVINSTTGIPQKTLLPILMRSDAQKATDEKEDKAMEEDRKARGIKPGQGFSMSADDEVAKSLAGTMGYRIGQINPDMLVSSMTDLKEETKVVTKTGVEPKTDSSFADLSASINASVKGYNEGGLVGSSITPIIESKNENGEMKRIDSISQSVGSNRQSIKLIGEQSQAMNLPNAQPNPVALANTPQTAPTEIKDTEAPIPFAMLLRQNAQRYLNLGNNAMVIS